MQAQYRLERFSALLCRHLFKARNSVFAAPPRQILARLLRNLKGIYLLSEEAQNMLEVMQRMAVAALHAAEAVRALELKRRRRIQAA